MKRFTTLKLMAVSCIAALTLTSNVNARTLD